MCSACSFYTSALSLSSYMLCTAAFVCQYLVGDMQFDASNQRQRCDVHISGLHFKEQQTTTLLQEVSATLRCNDPI